jgi:hypothetical protein
MVRFSAALLAAWLVCPAAMATTSCDKASADAVIADMTSDNDRQEELLKLREGTISLQDFRARSDKRSSGEVEARILLYQQSCSKGETLKVLSAWSFVVKELCDFNKSILNIGKETLCVMK